MKAIIGMAAVSLFACASAALAQEGPKMAFDATYESKSAAGASTMRMISDGKGHMRTETTTNGVKSVSITDYPNHCVLAIIDAQKLVMKMPIRTSPETDIHDAESAQKAKAKSLGARTIAGHPCHGWSSTSPTGSTDLWIGDDIHYMVKSESLLKNGQKVSTELKSWSAASPAPSEFKAPTGYKVTQMPGT